RDALPAVRLGDAEVADVRPAARLREEDAAAVRLDLDHPDGARLTDGGEARAVSPDAALQPKSRDRRRRGDAVERDRGQDLRLALLHEAGADVELADVRPRRRH